MHGGQRRDSGLARPLFGQSAASERSWSQPSAVGSDSAAIVQRPAPPAPPSAAEAPRNPPQLSPQDDIFKIRSGLFDKHHYSGQPPSGRPLLWAASVRASTTVGSLRQGVHYC
eukprot:Hpha_TRINITY_DN13863_c0_g2::TRINITY_DN13863_c0_g2_i2::g.69679::m.69679